MRSVAPTVVAGKDQNGHGYVLADISGRYPPHEWARLAIAAYRTHRADRIVAEVNNGGDMATRPAKSPISSRSLPASAATP
jgi:phage terminase large subunit-like protein